MKHTKPKEPLKLCVRGMSHVPTFKNNKMLVRGRIITDPRKQKWMEQCIQSFVSQLKSAIPTTAAATLTEHSLHYWTAWCSQFDDSHQWLPQMHLVARIVPPGEEGAEITIERLC